MQFWNIKNSFKCYLNFQLLSRRNAAWTGLVLKSELHGFILLKLKTILRARKSKHHLILQIFLSWKHISCVCGQHIFYELNKLRSYPSITEKSLQNKEQECFNNISICRHFCHGKPCYVKVHQKLIKFPSLPEDFYPYINIISILGLTLYIIVGQDKCNVEKNGLWTPSLN